MSLIIESVVIEKIVAGGDGLGRLVSQNGKTVFVPFSAVGDELKIAISENRTDYNRGEIIEILRSGQGRIEPNCLLYKNCGGCNLMHLSYEAQCEVKISIVKDAFKRITKDNSLLVNFVPSSPWAYRNKAKFSVDAKNTRSYLARGSNALIPVHECPILVPSLSKWLGEPCKLKAGVCNVFASDENIYVEGINEEASALILDKPFLFNAAGFFQSNITLLQELVKKVISDFLDLKASHKLDIAADLYCGVGLFAAFLLEHVQQLDCVEENKSSVSYALKNIGRKPSFYALSVENWLKQLNPQKKFDYILVDPPRNGLSSFAAKKLIELCPHAIAYVSCNPVSLARDAALLIKAGYKMQDVTIFDFYPQTSHIEAYAYFVR